MPRPADVISQDCYAAVVAALVRSKGVTVSERRGFGQGGLMIGGKLFATLRGPDLLLKLPSERVTALIAAKEGQPFDAGKDKPMREWVTVGPQSHAKWLSLAQEAMQFGQR